MGPFSNSTYIMTFWDKTYSAFNNEQISENERQALNRLYDSGKKIEAKSQLKGYCKRRNKVK